MEKIMFTDEELKIISSGILTLIHNANESKKLVHDHDADIQNIIDDKIKDYVSLNSKVCSMMK